MPVIDVIEFGRKIKRLPDGQRGPLLVRSVGLLPAADKKALIFDLVERREIPRTLAPADVETLAQAAGLSTAVVEGGFDAAAAAALSPLMQVTAPAGPLDPVALRAASETRKEFDVRLGALAVPRLPARGIAGTVEKVTGRLNVINLDDARRLVLAQASVYEVLFLDALDGGKIPDDDDAGITDHILTHVDADALRHFLLGVVNGILDAELIQLDPADREDIAGLAATRGLDLRSGRLTAAVLALVDVRRRQGNVPRLVDAYLAKQEIQAEAVDEAIRQAMIEYLVDLRLTMTFPAVVNGEFDEYFALAYDEARRQRAASDDPIDIARSGRRIGTSSDFSIPRIGQQYLSVVRPQAIQAAGGLFSVFVEGELMRMFDIADAVSLDWHRGGLDVAGGDTALLLNRIEHMRDERLDEAERGMLYRRLFNYGQAEMLSGTLVNEQFGEHFDGLMYEVTRFVDLQDRASGDPRQISRAGLYSAIVALQHNLNQFVTGSAFMKIEELISHLKECHELLTSPPVVARYGGAEESPTSAIKNMGLYLLDVSLPVEDLFELAERGNDVFAYVAQFTRGNVREDPFQAFLDAAKQTIIARAAVEGGDTYPPDRGRRRRPRPYEEDVAGRNGHGNGNGAVPAAVIDEWDR